MSRNRIGTRRALRSYGFTIATPSGPWPSNPVDGDLIINGTTVTLTDGAVKTYRDIQIINNGALVIQGSVQVGWTRNFTLDVTGSIDGDLNHSPGDNGYSGGNPSLYTFGPYTTPAGEVYSYDVTGAIGGAGGDNALNTSVGGAQYQGNGGGGASDSDGGTQAGAASGGEGASSSFGAVGGSGGSADTAGGDGESSMFATAGGGGGGGAGTGLPSQGILYLKGGAAAVVLSCVGFISFVGSDGRGGGGGGPGGGNPGVINSGGGGGSAGGFAGKMIVKIPAAQVAAWNPITDFSGGTGGAGGGAGSSGGADPGFSGADGGNGQVGEYTVVSY